MVAGPIGGYATDKFGRRKCILYMDGLLLVGSLVLAVAPNYNTILVGRFLVGCATAVSLVAAVSYLTELASVANHHHHHQAHHRGALVLSVQVSIALGFLASYLASYALSTAQNYNEVGWRLLLGVGTGFMAIVQWMGMWTMPESPQWLITMGYNEKAQVALSQFTTDAAPSHGNALGGNVSMMSASTRDAVLEARVLGRTEQILEYGELDRVNDNIAAAAAASCPALLQYWRQALM